jgi:hypothetical protein
MSRSVCPTCERPLPIPEEQREPRQRGQVNLTCPSPEEAESLRELIAHCREELDVALGSGKRVMAGTVVHAVLYDWLTGRRGA